MTGTAATQPLVTGTEVTQTLAAGIVATQTLVIGAADGPEDQPMPVSVAPIQKKKTWKQKSSYLVRDDEKEGPSREGEEEEEDELVVT